jgi:AIG2-like family
MNERVFAYGSNMCSGRFRDYGVSPEERGQCAVLGGYRLVFNKSSRDGSGKANVERHEGSEVWGVLYSISEADLATLDDGEGSGYRRLRLVVRTEECGETNCWVYVANAPNCDPLRPYGWYKRFLVEGAREHALPTEYVASLEAIDVAEDENKQRDTEKRALGCG